jgi:hypothetical protein
VLTPAFGERERGGRPVLLEMQVALPLETSRSTDRCSPRHPAPG